MDGKIWLEFRGQQSRVVFKLDRYFSVFLLSRLASHINTAFSIPVASNILNFVEELHDADITRYDTHGVLLF